MEKEAEQLKVGGHSDTILNFAWNWDASLFASSSKDRDLKIIDPRSNKVTDKVMAHDGAKGFKAVWLGKLDKIATSGFSKSSERGIALWDVRKLSTPLAQKTVDNQSGLVTPFYDPDTGVFYFWGKGDANIKMFELNDEAPFIHYLTEHSSNVPAIGLTLLAKQTCNIRECEIASWLKLCSDYVEPIHFSVPRTRMELFQDDLFPPTWDVFTPALSADEWLSGQNKNPSEINLKPSDMQLLSDAPVEKKDKKYDFKTEVTKEQGRFTKDRFLASYYNKMTGEHGESTDQVLKQDKMEGVAAEEWDG
jgi:WD40 repeat protein